MAKRLSDKKKLQILSLKHSSNLAISKICRQYQISRQTFYKWRKQFGHLLLSPPVSAWIYRRLEEDRRLLVEVVSSHGFKVTEACRRFCVSRTTYYKWRKRWDSGVGLSDFYRSRKISASKCSQEQIAAVLSLAYTNPKYSIRKIASLLQTAGQPWSLNVRGVYNVLKRYSLTTCEARLKLAQLAQND